MRLRRSFACQNDRHGRRHGFPSRRHTGWWLAGALLLALGALLAWTAWQNEALRGRVAALEHENRSLAARTAATVQPTAAPVATTVTVAPAAPAAPLPAADPMAAYARAPGSSPRQGPLEEALQRLREPAPRAGASPFGDHDRYSAGTVELSLAACQR